MQKKWIKYADITLVGDSLGSVLYNYNTTRKVTLNNMMEHSKSVRMGIKKSVMVVDMPYKTYQNKRDALKNSIKINTLKAFAAGCNLILHCNGYEPDCCTDHSCDADLASECLA